MITESPGAKPDDTVVWSARPRQAIGVLGGYLWPGYQLTGAVAGILETDVEEDVWAAKLGELADRIDRSDDEGVLAWVERELPRCMKLVPKRRRYQFLKARKRGRVRKRGRS